MKENKWSVRNLCIVGILAAMSYVCFAFLQIKIPIGGDATSIHLGNMVPVLGALLFGGLYGGLGGAIGMTIGDLFDPIYILYAPKTFFLKLCIGLVTGIVAHKLCKLSAQTDRRKILRGAILSAAAGLFFNVVFDPLVGYYYKLIILGKSAADLTLAWSIGATSINAITSGVVAVLLYMALRPALEKAGLLKQKSSNKEEQ
ncbi:MAG: ECF transporter S component [Faecalibacterium sp.]